MLSASSTRRWARPVAVDGASIMAERDISVPKIQKPGIWSRASQVFSALSVFSGCSSLKQQDRQRRDLKVLTTTTGAAAAGEHEPHHGTPGASNGQATGSMSVRLNVEHPARSEPGPVALTLK